MRAKQLSDEINPQADLDSVTFTGSSGDLVRLNTTRTGGGYLMVSKGGVVYSFGDAPQLGSVPDQVAGYRGTALGIDVVANGS